jgi:hypothetical protein
VVLRKGLWALAPFVVSVLALAPAPALAGCENANLNNPGHHYGLYKNGCLPSPVVTPAPAPAPTPKPKPVKHPPSTHVVTTQLSTSVKPDQSSGLSTLTLPIGPGNPTPAMVPVAENLTDSNLWLLTALLPALLVLWLLIAARTLTEGLRRRRRAASAA